MALSDAVSGDNLFHCFLIDIDIAGTTYYITDMTQEFVYDSNTYTPLGELLSVGTIVHTLNPGDQAVNIVVSGLGGDRDFKSLALNSRSKGGAVTIRRGLSSSSIEDLRNSANIYTVYKGFIKNINFAEQFGMGTLEVYDSVIFDCSNFWSLRKDSSNGRKTDPESFNRFRRLRGVSGSNYDRAMDRVAALNGKKFAFGRTG